METKFNVGDILYYVKDFRVVKIKIKESIIKTDKIGTTIKYIIINELSKKEFQCAEAELIKSFKDAKQCAINNWNKITIDVLKQLNELSEETFIKNEDNADAE